MLKEIKEFGPAITLVEAEQILGLKKSVLKAYVHKGVIIPREYLRRSGATWLVSVVWVEKKLEEKN